MCADHIENNRDLQVKNYNRPLKIRVSIIYIIVLGILILLFTLIGIIPAVGGK